MVGSDNSTNTSNEYLIQFNEIAVDNGLVEDLATLYWHETANDNVETASAILSLIVSLPGLNKFESTIDKSAKLGKHLEERHIKTLRANLSTKLLSTLEEVKPAEFSGWQDTKQYDEFLHLIHGHMLAEESREEFLNRRQQIRINWQAEVAKNSELNHKQLIADFTTEQEAQSKYRADMSVMMQQSHAAQQTALNRLQQLSRNQQQTATELNQSMQQVDATLNQQGLQIEQSTLLLLQSDALLSEQLVTVTSYLEIQEVRTQQQQQAQQRQANYQGVMDGFGLISAIGQQFNNKALSTVGKVCSQAVIIHKSISDISGMAGSAGSLAVLSPYAAAGMAILKIASMFMKSGPSPHQVILKQLQQLAKQIESMHLDMREQFADVHHHINYIEKILTRGIKNLLYFTTVPVVRRLDEIQSEIQQLTSLVQIGFQDLFVRDLSDIQVQVSGYLDGITTSVNQQQLQEWLIKLAYWVTERSYHRQLTAMYIFNDSEQQSGELVVSHKRLAQMLSNTRLDGISVINILLSIARRQSWFNSDGLTLHGDSEQASSDPNVGNSGLVYGRLCDVPHTGIWLQALDNYLRLRSAYNKQNFQAYDVSNKQIQLIYQQLLNAILILEQFTNDITVVIGAHNKICELYTTLSNQYDNLTKLHQSRSLLAANEVDIPQQFSFEYVPGHDTGKRKHRQREFTEKNGFSQTDCLRLVAATASQQHKLQLFTPDLLRAEQLGLLEFRFRMHRTMSNNANQVYKTDGGSYGLETQLYLCDTRKRISLTKPTAGKAWWSSADKNTTRVTIESHKKALPQKTQFIAEKIRGASEEAASQLKKMEREAQQSFQQLLSTNLFGENAVAQQLLLYLWIGRMLSVMSNYRYMDVDYNREISELSKMLNSIENFSETNHMQINKFFGDLPAKLQSMKAAQPSLQLSSGNCKPLQNLVRGRQNCLSFAEGAAAFFANRGEPIAAKPNVEHESAASCNLQ